MDENERRPLDSGRRDFFKTAGAGLAAGATVLSGAVRLPAA